AMLGLTAGALCVYLMPLFKDEKRTGRLLSGSAALFAAAIPLSLLVHLLIPIRDMNSGTGMALLAFEFLVIAVPFFFSGINITLALTRNMHIFRKLYAFDLLGAALGCIAFIWGLNFLDAPSFVLLVAVGGLAAAAVYAEEDQKWRRMLMGIAVLGGVLCLVNHAVGWVDLYWVKGEKEAPALVERWNSFSRVRVTEWDTKEKGPFCWGMSSQWSDPDFDLEQKLLQIDGFAGTVLTRFEGDLSTLDFLRYDVSNVGHHIAEKGDALIIGVGGGRDLLTAMNFGHDRVTGVEVNPNILEIVHEDMGDFTGHLDKRPGLRFEAAEARNFMENDTGRYDFLQVSMIDTWAATAAGAYALTENSLYTVEAWRTYLRRLKGRGLLSFSRWYMPGIPGETYRMAALAGAALRAEGIQNPENHFLCIGKINGSLDSVGLFSIGTTLLRPTPFTPAEVAQAQKIADSLDFLLIAAPGHYLDSTYFEVLSRTPDDPYFAEFPIDISAPTDDRPFFFNMLRFSSIFSSELVHAGSIEINMRAITTLAVLAGITLILLLIFVLLPAFLRRRVGNFRSSAPFFGYFLCIGMGFMLVEIALMQKLTVFLGNPAYSTTVVLATILVAGGTGSYLVRKTDLRLTLLRLVGIGVVLGLTIALLQPILYAAHGLPAGLRIAVCILVLFPAGLAMGMALPSGMNLADRSSPGLAPWLWGVNGGASVFASVLAMVLAIAFGITTAFIVGIGFYACALACIALLPKSPK
ncbi:MAG: hypothetical protein AAF570_07835, partial [Bacteroidota bacterium]